mgnify:FL=1
MYDELQLDTLGDKKTALFLIMSDTDSTFNFLISMVYTQLFNLLCDKADDVYGGKLPVHVRCLIDECANIGQIPNLEKLVATIRSREISACLVLQARSQLKAIYKDNADTIVGNMDSQIFLGGSEPTTLKELSETLGKETIDAFNTSDTRGNSPSYGTTFQKMGHELLSRDELAVLDGGKCILQLRGVRPFLSDKYDLPVCITHDNFDRLENDLDALIAEHRIYGCNRMGVGMMPKKFRTGKLEDLDKFISFLNSAAQKLAGEGMTIAYHNHWFEFDEIDGKVIYDYIIEHTDPRVEFIPDTYWIRFAGKDIEKYLEKLKGRVNTLHLKDYKNKIFRAVGKGTLDFKSILETAEKCGVQNAVVELDFSPNPYKSVEFSMNTLKRIANAN